MTDMKFLGAWVYLVMFLRTTAIVIHIAVNARYAVNEWRIFECSQIVSAPEDC